MKENLKTMGQIALIYLTFGAFLLIGAGLNYYINYAFELIFK